MTVTGGHDTRVSLAALIAVRPGCRPRLIFRTHRARRADKRKGFTETDYARFLDAAHQQLHGPVVLVRDGLNTHASRAMRELIAARDWLTVFRLPPYAPELNPVENVWEFLRANLLSHRVWDTYDAILDACQDAWNKLMRSPERIASLTRRTWAKPVTG